MLLDSFQFNGTSACQPLLDGLTLLKELNASERLKRVPSDAPIDKFAQDYSVPIREMGSRLAVESCRLAQDPRIRTHMPSLDWNAANVSRPGTCVDPTWSGLPRTPCAGLWQNP
jgi:hypothetical protein